MRTPSLAYLAARETLPGPARRDDAFEHDQMMGALKPAAAAAGTTIEAVAWDAAVAWSTYDAAIIGTTWDYHARPEAFLAALDDISKACPLFNPVALVGWNLDKRYLRDLAARGIPSIETIWADIVDETTVAEAFDRLQTDDLVLKRQIGAGAHGQVRLGPHDPVPDLPHAMMIQPFLPSITTEGELSFIFVDGELSHALRKRAAAGDYRIQSLYGGTEMPFAPTDADHAAAKAVVDVLEEPPLYARVDLIRAPDGALRLMELELIEPFLYPVQGPHLGERLIAATLRRLGR